MLRIYTNLFVVECQIRGDKISCIEKKYDISNVTMYKFLRKHKVSLREPRKQEI